jgi:hypothetical protein
MKFRDGAWLWADGVNAACMKRVHEYRIDGDTLVVVAVDRNGSKGEDRFGVGATSFICHRSGDSYVLSCDGRAKRVRALFRDWSGPEGLIVNGKILDQSAQGVLVQWLDTSKPLEVRGPNRPTPQVEHLRSSSARDKLRA